MGSESNNDKSGTSLKRIVSLVPGMRFAVFLFITILLVYGLIAARDFLFPFAFATLFSYLLYPVVNFLEKRRFPRILAILSAILLAFVVIGALFFLFYRQLSNMFENFDALQKQAVSNIEQLQQHLATFLGVKNDGIEVFLKEQFDQFFGSSNGGIRKAFTATTGTIFRIVLLPIYVFLLLFYRTKFAYFILKITPEGSRRTTVTILKEISTVAGRYMGGVSIVVLILSVLNSSGLAIIGVDYAILLGIVSACFNFIPYFGTLMGGAVPLTFVLLTTDDPLYFGIRVVILFLIVQFTENYILTPNIVGGNVKINPLIIIVGLVVGAVIWGIPGLLVIVPFLAILKIIFSHIPRLQPYAYLLGLKGTSRYAISFSNIKKKLHLNKKTRQQEDSDVL